MQFTSRGKYILNSYRELILELIYYFPVENKLYLFAIKIRVFSLHTPRVECGV